MIKKIKIIRELKRLRKKPVDKIFLNSLKMKLEVLADAYPSKGKTANPAYETLRSIFSLRVVQVSFASFMIVVLLGASVAAASQESLPGEKLYPVKIFAEEARSIIAIKNTTKAKLRIDFAEKRIYEIEKILEEKEIESDNLEIALTQFEKNFTKINDIIEGKRSSATDINSDMTAIRQDIDKNKEKLERAINEKKIKAEKRQKELEEKIKKTNKEERLSKEALIDELVEVRINKEILDIKEDDIRKMLEYKKENEEIKEYEDENKYNLRQEKIDEELKSKNNEIKNKRENIKSREESKKEIREKIIKEIIDNEDDGGENDYEDDNGD